MVEFGQSLGIRRARRVIDLRGAQLADGRREVIGATAGSVARPRVDDHAIALITCVNDPVQYETCLRYADALDVPEGYAVETIAVVGAPSMAEGYQRAMEASAARYKIYLHQDVYLIHRGLLPELIHLFRTHPRLGMVGVVGATRLPSSGVWFVNNPLHCFGHLWEYRRPGGPSALLGPLNLKRLHFMRFRPFVGDYLPAVAVDGLFIATQYDLPWKDPLGGFDLYEQVHAAEFIRAGLEVGIARQTAAWCLHWGPLREVSEEEHRRRQEGLRKAAAAFCREYGEFVRVPARRLYERHRERARRWELIATGSLAPADVRAQGDARLARAGTGEQRGARAAEQLGVVIVTFNGKEVLRKALRALLPQCEGLDGVETQIVVVDNASSDGTAEAVRQEFPQVNVVANARNDGPARGFNIGLRHLREPSWVLVMNNDVEFIDGTLARMVGFLREHPEAAGVVAALSNPDGSDQYQRMATLELVPRRPRRVRPISFVGTTCALVRADVFSDVGLYDERFYFYNEDLDWSLRARRKGYTFYFLPEARVIHYGSVGLRQNRPAIFAELFAANLWYLYKHAGPRWAAAMYQAQRLQARWLAFKWRGDPEALRQLREAVGRMERLYGSLREPGVPASRPGPAAERVGVGVGAGAGGSDEGETA